MRTLLLILTALATVLGAAAGAHASTVWREQPSGALFYNGEGSEENRLQIPETEADYGFTDSLGVTPTPR